jgi:8-oxo-dGTP pyrophosphatase MutT (NUDIX family)
MSKVNEINALLLNDKTRLIDHIINILYDRSGQRNLFGSDEIEWHTTAGVVLLLAQCPDKNKSYGEPCIVLNKRSLKVRQPGDLCFPGGGISPHIDPVLARFFSLPIGSLGLWRHWAEWKKSHARESKWMSIIWATGLRESFEEMRLNPFGVRFLGPLPPQSLVMFKRTIYPMVGWIRRQKRFFPNWEVEKVVYVPLKDLLNSNNYGRYRLRMGGNPGSYPIDSIQDFPCFRLPTGNQVEILWGATYRITIDFLDQVFGFTPPNIETLPVVEGVLDESYLTGNK